MMMSWDFVLFLYISTSKENSFYIYLVKGIVYVYLSTICLRGIFSTYLSMVEITWWFPTVFMTPHWVVESELDRSLGNQPAILRVRIVKPVPPITKDSDTDLSPMSPKLQLRISSVQGCLQLQEGHTLARRIGSGDHWWFVLLHALDVMMFLCLFKELPSGNFT